MGRHTVVIAIIVAAGWILYGFMMRHAGQQTVAVAAAPHSIVRQESTADPAREKEQAWQKFYSTSESCEHPPTWRDQVECSNQFLQAKKQFELWWNIQKTSARARVE
jgi:hypothetical protein